MPNILHAGLPSSPSSGSLYGEGPIGSIGDHQYPITADFVGKHQKMNPRIIIVIALSAFVLLVVCCAAVTVLLKCRKARRPSNAVGPVFTPSMNKRSGMFSCFLHLQNCQEIVYMFWMSCGKLNLQHFLFIQMSFWKLSQFMKPLSVSIRKLLVVLTNKSRFGCLTMY